MRDYGVVSPQFWIGQTGKSLRGNPAAQLVALYLTTSPHANMIGVYYCPVDTIAKETGLTLEGASEALRSLEEAGYCQFDPDTEEVFVTRMAAFQVGEQLEPRDNRCKGIARDIDKVMSTKLRSAFRAIYSGAFHLQVSPPKPPGPAAPPQAPSKPLRSQEQEQEQKQEQKQEQISVPDGTGGFTAKPAADVTKAELWSVGKSLLAEQGMPKAQCGSFVGKLVSDYGEGLVIEAVRSTCVARPADAAEYLKACCMRAAGQRAGKSGSRHSGFETKNYREGVAADGSLT